MKYALSAWSRNRRSVRLTWGKLNREAMDQLRSLTMKYCLSLAAGDIQLLNGHWYVTHSGLVGIASTFGAILGPVIVGRVFDITASYAIALILFSAVAFAGAFATLACRTYRIERLRAPVPALVAGL